MLLYIALFAFVVLALFPLGRELIGVLFSFVAGALGSYDDTDDYGPHYDHYSGDVHAYKEVGGMYDKD